LLTSEHPSRKYSITLFSQTDDTLFPAAKRTTTTTKREKQEVITARVSFPSVPLERKWWCEYSSLSLNENARFFREIYFFSSFSHQKRENVAKKERSQREKRQPFLKSVRKKVISNASRRTKSAAHAAPTVFFVFCDDDDQESDH